MLRLTDIRLPLGHSADKLPSAILKRLQITPAKLRGYTVARLAFDARQRNAIVAVY